MENNKFWDEAENIMSKNPTIKKGDFEKLLKIAEGEAIGVNPIKFVDKMVSNMFSNGITTFIPWEFFDTEVGGTIIKAKFLAANKLYKVSDIAKLLELTRTFIYAEIDRNNLKADKNKMVRYIDLIKFMDDKGYSKKEEIKKNVYGSSEDSQVKDYKEVPEKIISPVSEREEEYK